MGYRGQNGTAAILEELRAKVEAGARLTDEEATEYRLSTLEQSLYNLAMVVVDQNRTAVSKLDRDASKYAEIGNDFLTTVTLIRELSDEEGTPGYLS